MWRKEVNGVPYFKIFKRANVFLKKKIFPSASGMKT